MVVLNKNVVARKWINPLSRLKSVLEARKEAGFPNLNNQIEMGCSIPSYNKSTPHKLSMFNALGKPEERPRFGPVE